MPTLANEVRAIEAADVLSAMGLGGRPGDVESLPELFFYTHTTHDTFKTFLYTHNLVSDSLGMGQHV